MAERNFLTEEQEEQFQLVCDEIKVLHSIFSSEGEFLVDGSPLDTCVDVLCRNLVEGKIHNLQVSVHVSCGEGIQIELGLSLGNHYPCSIPEISVSSLELTRKKLEEIHKHLMDYAKTECPGREPVVLKVVNWLQENVPSFGSALEKKPAENKMSLTKEKLDEKVFIAVLRFDHMRARKKYLKSISQWMKELNLNGCILFFAKNIIAIVEGLKHDINKYLKRIRTSTVDVDSAGRSCKERMMDLICELEKTEQHSINDGFKIIDCTSLQEFVKIFERTGLSDIYQSYIKHSI